jgi:hypothetical protein
VEYYHVDYVGLRKRFYSAEGEMMATPINYEGLPPVAPEFDAAALRANILDSQRHGQPYREFTRRGPCRTGHLITGRAAVPRSPLYFGGAAATALPMAAGASPTGVAPAISTRNGSPALGRLKKIEPVIYYSGGLLSDRTTLRTNNYDLSRRQSRQERENFGHQRQGFIKLGAGTKSNRAGNVRKSARAMPEADNFKALVVVIHPINDPVGTENNFAQFRSAKFRHDAPAFWKSFQRQRRIKQLVAHAFGGNEIVGRNLGDDALQIIQRVVGEEYFEIHCGMRWRASSKGMRSPRSSDASPSSTACRNSSS